MFSSFFPRPRLFFGTFLLFSVFAIYVWFELGEPLSQYLAIGHYFGFAHLDYNLLHSLQEEAKHFSKETDPARIHAAMEQIKGLEHSATFWFYEFLLACYAIFLSIWAYLGRGHRWLKWSLYGTAFIVFVAWIMVETDVMINEWFGTFYNMVQDCFKYPGSIKIGDYYGELFTFFVIAGAYVIIMTLNTFFVQHYNFRWRTAMNDHYTGLWKRVRHIEGASQRIQEDAMRFADIMEGLGAGFLDAVMTLVAFTPILIGLSMHIGEIPVVGKITQGLLWVALGWSLIGTLVLFVTGHYLPLLQFRNQRVEAAYRDELVLGMRDPAKAQPMTLAELFGHIRKNYFKLYFHYMYFNVVRYSYLQASVLVPYVALAPTLTSEAAIVGGFTLGVMQQTIRAFGRIQESFQYLVRSWPTIIELLSIYKRLKAFDLAEKGLPLQDIDLETDK